MDAVVDGMFKNAKEPEWLEKYVFGEFRVWQIIFLTFTGITALIIALCCCIKFRVPRTKQQIEADYQRRIITGKFREQLERIQNSEMDAIDLKAALDLVRAEFKSDTESEKEHQSASLISSIASHIPSSEENSMLMKNPSAQKLVEPQKEVKISTVLSFSNKIAALVKKSKQNSQPVEALC